MFRNSLVFVFLAFWLAVGCSSIEPSYLHPTEKEALSHTRCEQQRVMVIQDQNAIAGYVFVVHGYRKWSRCSYDI